VDAISLGEGSTLSGVRGRAFTTSALSGIGTVAGDLTLGDGCLISVATVVGGSIGGTTVNGTLTLGNSLRVVVGGAVKPEIGTYRICSADVVEGTVDSFAVTPFPGDARPYAVSVDSAGVVLKVMPSGCCIIFR
jgi:hypothetical protein